MQIKKLKRLDEIGTEIVEEVQNLRQGQPNMNTFHCNACREHVLETDFEENTANNNRSEICEICLDDAIHVRCMSQIVKRAHERL